jgi:DNA-binding beta-propeller fold protein YncE
VRIHTSQSWITLVAIQDWKNHRIRKVNPRTGETSTLVGSTEFSSPMGIAIDPDGNFALVSVRACPSIPASAHPAPEQCTHSSHTHTLPLASLLYRVVTTPPLRFAPS